MPRLSCAAFFILFLIFLKPHEIWAGPRSDKNQVVKAPVTQIKILEVTGTIKDLSQQGRAQVWSSKTKITDRLQLSVDAGAQTKIQLHPSILLTVFENTEFEIPLINWDTRQFKNLKLIKGAIRLEVFKGHFDFNLETPFFQLEPPEGTWVFALDLQRALADVMALQGNIQVQSLNSDDKVSLKTGEKATFRGLLEEGEISYDLLLHGRKVPKGKWSEVTSISNLEDKTYSLYHEKKRIEQKEKLNALKQKKDKNSLLNATCLNPRGDFQDCYWKKESQGCFRRRCAADGTWKDPQVSESEFCPKNGGSISSSQKCDY